MKIAISVHGRFHAFDLARALLARGHDVTVLTNYPRWAAARFGLAGERVRGFWPQGVLSRAAWRLAQRRRIRYPEAALHRLFGRWAARQLARESWDVIHTWSGVSEEALRSSRQTAALVQLVRLSTHICTQARLLREEEARTGVAQEQPSAWMIEREEREYGLAEQIVVPSSFAFNSFVAEGVSTDKLSLLLTGADLRTFRPSNYVVEARIERILSGAPIRVLNVGTFSLQKGVWDLAAAMEELDGGRFAFRFVGPIPPEGLPIARELRGSVTFVPKRPQAELPAQYAWGDVFVLPSIQDGFQAVLGQAAAGGLPILTTPNGAGYDLVRDGQNGWVVPIRSPRAIAERLRWCDTHRTELAAMVERTYATYRPRDWSDVAAEFEALCVASMPAAPARG